MIEERPDVDLFAHWACNGCSCTGSYCARGPTCTRNARSGLLSRSSSLLSGYTGLLDGWLHGCSGFGTVENARHHAETQRSLHLRWGHRWSSLRQGGRGKQSGKHEFRFHG
jgi:hypothetical protein